jgi:hypothetical protein
VKGVCVQGCVDGVNGRSAVVSSLSGFVCVSVG